MEKRQAVVSEGGNGLDPSRGKARGDRLQIGGYYATPNQPAYSRPYPEVSGLSNLKPEAWTGFPVLLYP